MQTFVNAILLSMVQFTPQSTHWRSNPASSDTAMRLRCDEKNQPPQIIYDHRTDGISIARHFANGSSVYRDVQRVREADGPVYFSFDDYSYHYCLYVDRDPVGCLTSTFEVDGSMDCRDFYPMELLQKFGRQTFSPCKFRILRNRHSSFGLMRLFVREFWRDQLRQGGRLAMMNATHNMWPFYRRMGFAKLDVPTFIHPDCGTESIVLMLSADPDFKSYFSDIFDTVDDTLDMDLVQATLSFQSDPLVTRTMTLGVQ